jgi:hypothetical protein
MVRISKYHKFLSMFDSQYIGTWVIFGFLAKCPKATTMETANRLTHPTNSCINFITRLNFA